MTTFWPAAATADGWIASPPTARTEAMTATPKGRMVENDRRRDALWAPSWDTGNALASSPPEHRAWGAETVGGAAGDRRARGHASGRAVRGMGAIGRGPTGWRGRDPGPKRGGSRSATDRNRVLP